MENQFTFTKPFNLEIKSDGRVMLEGEISNTEKDLVNDVVTKHCLESMKDQINDRNIKLDLEHESFRGDSVEEKEINKTKIPIGKIAEAEVKKNDRGGFSLNVKCEVNRNHQRFEEVKGHLTDKYLDAYSIAFIPTETKSANNNGESVRLLDDVRLLNVALTGNPVNTTAQNRDVFMKSMDAVEEYKKEKKANPEIEDQLEVKAGPGGHKPNKTGPNGRGKGPGEGRADGSGMEDEDEEEKKKKKPEKKNHNPLNSSNLDQEKNQKEVKMSEEQTEQTESEESQPVESEKEAPVEAPAEEAEVAPEAEAEAKAKKKKKTEDEESEDNVESKSIDLKSVVEANVVAIKAIQKVLKMPVHKSLAMPEDKTIVEKSVSPLDAIK